MHGEHALSYALPDAAAPGLVQVPRSRARDCPVCLQAARGRTADYWQDLAEPARRRVGAEAIVDHLGFCARHSVELRGVPCTPAFAAVAGEALGILAAMLEDRVRYEERLVHIMFHARQGCAACTQERRRAPVEPAALAGAARRLCLPHYAATAAKCDERQLALFAAGALDSARAWNERLEQESTDEADSVRAMLDWLAGEHSGHARVSSQDWRCPVCRAADFALERWLEQVETAVRLDIELGAILPLCSLHMRMCVERWGGRVAREVACQATAAVAMTLERGLQANARAVKLDREASTSVWYRRRAASYVLGLRRRALRLPHCGACERVDLACQQAQGEILDLVAHRSGREAIAERGELCLRHFGAVYMLCPHGEPRAALAARQREALVHARDALARGDAGDGWTRAADQLMHLGAG
jgi:hypothetical protein